MVFPEIPKDGEDDQLDEFDEDQEEDWEADLDQCGAFQLEYGNPNSAYVCSSAGTEFCDWACPMGGYGWWDRDEEE